MLKFKIQKAWGKTPNNYTHFPLLWLGFGKQTIGLTILGIIFTISWGSKKEVDKVESDKNIPDDIKDLSIDDKKFEEFVKGSHQDEVYLTELYHPILSYLGIKEYSFSSSLNLEPFSRRIIGGNYRIILPDKENNLP